MRRLYIFTTLLIFIAVIIILLAIDIQSADNRPTMSPECAQSTTEENITEEEYLGVSRKELELIALIVMAEAESESNIGKKLVADVILNRVDSKHFPNSISDVVYQKAQFTPVWNGRLERCYVDKDIYKLVMGEYEDRLDYDVIFFNAGSYSRYGSPLYQIGNHYFSSFN